MAYGFALLKFINVGVQRSRAHAEITSQKAAQIGALLHAGKHLHTIASGKHHAFIHTGLLYQTADGVRQLGFAHGKPLTHLKRRAVVVHADNVEVHGARNLCVWLTLFAAQASTAAPKANVAKYAARRPLQPALQRVYRSTMYTTHISPESKILGSAKYLVP